MLGDINIDTVWPVDKMPEPGRDAYVQEVAVGLGGAVLNTAIVLDKFGQRTAMLSCMGDDVWARQVSEKLAHTGINLEYVRIKPQYASGLIFIAVTPDGERTMFSQRGANIHYGPQDLDEEVFRRAAILHLSGYSLLESPQKEALWRAVELAHQYHVPISLDSGFEPAFIDPDGLRQLMPEVDICVTGPQEIAELYGLSDPQEAAAHLLSLGVKLAAIKLGERGGFVADGEDSCFYPAFKIDVADTTGAGDSFTAGLLYGWMGGLSLPSSAVLASALGALAATVYGAGLSLPGKRELLAFLKAGRENIPVDMQDRVADVVSYIENL